MKKMRFSLKTSKQMYGLMTGRTAPSPNVCPECDKELSFTSRLIVSVSLF